MNPSNETMDKTAQGMMQACEDMNMMARQQMDATVKALTTALQGYGEIHQNVGSLMQDTLTRTMSAGKNMMSAKSVREVMDTHAEFTRDWLDCLMAGTGKISEISARITKEAMEPIAQHANATMSKMTTKSWAA